jgi:hypothetical protein
LWLLGKAIDVGRVAMAVYKFTIYMRVSGNS